MKGVNLTQKNKYRGYHDKNLGTINKKSGSNYTKKSKGGESVSLKHTSKSSEPTPRNSEPTPRNSEPTPRNSEPTPRTKYANKYFKNLPVLLDRDPDKSRTALFQVSFETPDQFDNYVNLSSATPKVDCFFQSLFSLGLINVETAKKNARDINLNGKTGVIPKEIIKYITSSFGLSEQEMYFQQANTIRNKSTNKFDKKVFKKEAEGFFNKRLENNHATIFSISFARYNKHYFHHAVVAYKYNDVVYYFDPQVKGIELDKYAKSKSILNIQGYMPYTYGAYYVYDLDEPKELVKQECLIKYV